MVMSEKEVKKASSKNTGVVKKPVRKASPQDKYAALADQYDRRARKDSALNMRISSVFLDDMKAAAEKAGFDKYQQWVYSVLSDAVASSKGYTVEKP